MPDGNDQHVIKVIGALSNISADEWNACGDRQSICVL